MVEIDTLDMNLHFIGETLWKISIRKEKNLSLVLLIF